MNSPQVFRFQEKEEWVQSAVREILADTPDPFLLALSGGSTPAPVYEELAKRVFPWETVSVFLADERCVPPNHPDANAKLIRESFPVPARFFLPETTSPDCGAKHYETLFREQGGVFDVAVLGIGPDGHIASLFPHSPALSEDHKLVTTSETEQFAVRQRITFTLPVLLNAKKLIVLLKGKSKEEVLTEWFSGSLSSEEFPAKYLLKHPYCFVFFYEE
ncbi:6-phosphogluconolactonase [Candidatus Peregrinibacteria bacterium]|nr:MAG: 6-phosphogluconolactonase [Candidatus Peregrinibacteria bacterium]